MPLGTGREGGAPPAQSHRRRSAFAMAARVDVPEPASQPDPRLNFNERELARVRCRRPGLASPLSTSAHTPCHTVGSHHKFPSNLAYYVEIRSSCVPRENERENESETGEGAEQGRGVSDNGATHGGERAAREGGTEVSF